MVSDSCIKRGIHREDAAIPIATDHGHHLEKMHIGGLEGWMVGILAIRIFLASSIHRMSMNG